MSREQIVKMWVVLMFISICLLGISLVMCNSVPNTTYYSIMKFSGISGAILFILSSFSACYLEPLKTSLCNKDESIIDSQSINDSQPINDSQSINDSQPINNV